MSNTATTREKTTARGKMPTTPIVMEKFLYDFKQNRRDTCLNQEGSLFTNAHIMHKFNDEIVLNRLIRRQDNQEEQKQYEDHLYSAFPRLSACSKRLQ